jgi:hypothetical protein
MFRVLALILALASSRAAGAGYAHVAKPYADELRESAASSIPLNPSSVASER